MSHSRPKFILTKMCAIYLAFLTTPLRPALAAIPLYNTKKVSHLCQSKGTSTTALLAGVPRLSQDSVYSPILLAQVNLEDLQSMKLDHSTINTLQQQLEGDKQLTPEQVSQIMEIIKKFKEQMEQTQTALDKQN